MTPSDVNLPNSAPGMASLAHGGLIDYPFRAYLQDMRTENAVRSLAIVLPCDRLRYRFHDLVRPNRRPGDTDHSGHEASDNEGCVEGPYGEVHQKDEQTKCSRRVDKCLTAKSWNSLRREEMLIERQQVSCAEAVLEFHATRVIDLWQGAF